MCVREQQMLTPLQVAETNSDALDVVGFIPPDKVFDGEGFQFHALLNGGDELHVARQGLTKKPTNNDNLI